MDSHEKVSVQTLESQAFALAARLHVILRREKGRVTDVEYMQRDPAYCRHVIGLIDSHASDDVRALCAKLEQVYLGPQGIFARMLPAVASPSLVPEVTPAALPARASSKKENIGRLR